jgi:hypothetical protein
MNVSELVARYDELPPAERAEIDRLIADDMKATPWRPLVNVGDPYTPTPQQQAYESQADLLLYGGAAGGGKTDLIIGLALTQHHRSIVFRREFAQLQAFLERTSEIVGGSAGRNTQDKRWALPGSRLLRWGGMQHLGDENAYKGQPHDLMAFDEVVEFLEFQFRFVITWNRTTDPTQRCRVIAATNPPQSTDGEWVNHFWAPWLDDGYPHPAMPGELRWFISDAEGHDTEVDGPRVVMVSGEPVAPRSRTFIPSSVDDNPYLMATGYKATLQALPEPLRSQMLRGSFLAGREDHPWQVIPREWARLAVQRWTPERPKSPMLTMGVDVAQGGPAETVLSPRHDKWFGKLICVPGKDTPDGPRVAGMVVQHLRDGAQVNVDVGGGWGAEAYGHLMKAGVPAEAANGVEDSSARDRSGKLGFYNRRAEWWWGMREALDPEHGIDIALPDDPKLLADLCTPRWRLTTRGILVESKKDIIKRLGHSPDRGDAAVLALTIQPRVKVDDFRSVVHSPNAWMGG